MTIRQYYKDADAGFDSTIDVGVILTIRWLAIIGQGAALLFTHLFLQLDLPLLPALFVISLSVAVNLWQIMQTPQSRQRHRHNSFALGFDVVQLAALLYLTGGLLNPFSVMILAPVVVSAAVLRRKSTLMDSGAGGGVGSRIAAQINLDADWFSCGFGQFSGFFQSSA